MGTGSDSNNHEFSQKAEIKKTGKEVKKDSSWFQWLINGLIIGFSLFIAFVSYKLFESTN